MVYFPNLPNKNQVNVGKYNISYAMVEDPWYIYLLIYEDPVNFKPTARTLMVSPPHCHLSAAGADRALRESFFAETAEVSKRRNDGNVGPSVDAWIFNPKCSMYGLFTNIRWKIATWPRGNGWVNIPIPWEHLGICSMKRFAAISAKPYV